MINDKRLRLDQIDRLARTLERSTAQGSGTVSTARSTFGPRQGDSGPVPGQCGDRKVGNLASLWDQLDALIRDEIQPRLPGRTLRQIADTGSAEIGGGRTNGRGRFTVTMEGLEARTMFSKPVLGVDRRDVGGDIELLTEGSDGKQRKRRLGLLAMEGDAWAFPFLWQHYRGKH